MLRTWLTERFGMQVPVVSAPMAGASGGELAAAVTRAGGLGMIGAGSGATPQWLAQETAVPRATGGAWGVGLMAWALPQRPEQLDAVVEARPSLVSVSFGDHRPAAKVLRDNGIAVACQVGTLAEARAAADGSVDLLVVRGAEGGGHGRGEVGTLPLLQEVLDAVDLPVLAAGGISGPRGLAAVLAAGAAGAWVGTAFLATTEALTSPAARERLLAAGSDDTAYGRVWDVGARIPWPAEFGGRALSNRYQRDWTGREAELATSDEAYDEARRGRAEADYDVAPLYAGQAVGAVTRERSVAEVVAELATAEDLLAALQERLRLSGTTPTPGAPGDRRD